MRLINHVLYFSVIVRLCFSSSRQNYLLSGNEHWAIGPVGILAIWQNMMPRGYVDVNEAEKGLVTRCRRGKQVKCVSRKYEKKRHMHALVNIRELWHIP